MGDPEDRHVLHPERRAAHDAEAVQLESVFLPPTVHDGLASPPQRHVVKTPSIDLVLRPDALLDAVAGEVVARCREVRRGFVIQPDSSFRSIFPSDPVMVPSGSVMTTLPLASAMPLRRS